MQFVRRKSASATTQHGTPARDMPKGLTKMEQIQWKREYQAAVQQQGSGCG